MHRVADAAINIYSSAAVLSRATYAIKNKSSSADFERKVATYYVDKVIFDNCQILSFNFDIYSFRR